MKRENEELTGGDLKRLRLAEKKIRDIERGNDTERGHNTEKDDRSKIKDDEKNTNGDEEEFGNREQKDVSIVVPKALDSLLISRTERTIRSKRLAEKWRKTDIVNPNRTAIDREFEIASTSKSAQEYRDQISSLLSEGETPPDTDPKLILPREVLPSAPALIQDRKKFVQVIAESLKRADAGLKTPILKALDIEHEIASSTSNSTYQQVLKRKVYEINHPEKVKVPPKKLTENDFKEALEKFVISPEVLSKYGYIMDIPDPQELEPVQTCRRCKTEYPLATQLEPTKCLYHPGKISRNAQNVRAYECCGAAVNEAADPCTLGDHHVFYVKEPKVMQHIQPFKWTEDIFQDNPQSFKAVGIDCEMGFTTMGFELLRISAIDFFTNEEVVDILVRPQGEVIDLNTRWSGISEIKEEALSFDQLIDLLGLVIDSNTILIGHGLENDLNAMRLLHKRVVDTAILFPRHKTSPTFRYSLKNLAFQYLGRTIQEGQHDSGEDSIAAIDLVKHFIKLERKHDEKT